MHFTVLVIGDEPEYQLAPYNQNAFQTEFHDEEAEWLELYQTGNRHLVRSEDGTLVPTWKSAQDGAEVILQPLTEAYATFEEFVAKHIGATRDQRKGRYGFWINPLAQWDWYKLGGRWTGYFKLKDPMVASEYSKTGEPGVFGSAAEFGFVDQALLGEIESGIQPTFAVLHGGMWLERDDRDSDAEWEKEFAEMIASLPPTTLVSLYDCHM